MQYLFLACKQGQPAKGNSNNDKANFRIVQLSPDSPNFDFCDNGVIFATNIAYTDLTHYKYVPAAPTTNSFTRSNAGDGCEGVLNTSVFALPAGASVSAIAMGSKDTVPAGAITGPPATIAFDDNSPADKGMVKVRFFNFALATGAETVDLFVDDNLIANDIDAITGFTFLPVTQYSSLEQGRVNVDIRDNNGNTLASAAGVKLNNRGVYTVFFHGNDSTGTGILVTEDSNNGRVVK